MTTCLPLVRDEGAHAQVVPVDGYRETWQVGDAAEKTYDRESLAEAGAGGAAGRPGDRDRDRAVDGWRARLPLHRVPTLLLHAVAFGAGYRDQARHAAARHL